jgi:hypothetical protein
MFIFLMSTLEAGFWSPAWRSTSWVVSSSAIEQFSVSVRIRHASGGEECWLTTVYGPARDTDKPEFLAELYALRQVRAGPWVICGDLPRGGQEQWQSEQTEDGTISTLPE